MKFASSNIVRIAIAVCFGTVWGCGSRPVSRVPQAPPPSASLPSPLPRAPMATGNPTVAAVANCGLSSGPGDSTSSISSVGLAERIDPSHAPYPLNDSERLLFRQLYETLIRLDCEGHLVPGLADSWRVDSSAADGTTWVFTLRQNARFSDNSPITAADVAASWMSVGAGRAIGSELRPEVRRLVRSIRVVDDRTLEIELQSRRADAILALAHTDLAIAKFVAGSQWPIGTTDFRIDSGGTAPSTGSAVITLTRLSMNSSTRFFVAPGIDRRDLLDQGVDLLLTRDLRTLDYAATLPQFAAAPLPWHRTHVLLMPGPNPTALSFSAEERKALAADAVRAEARGAEGPFWWESLADCEFASPVAPAQSTSRTGRIVYDADDSAARELAERFVGIGTFPRANGLTSEALAQALRRGNESAYILSLERRPLDACREMHALVDSANWIDAKNIVPLVDTRLYAIVRRGRSGLIAEWDATILLDGAGK